MQTNKPLRPSGITILAILAAIGGVLGLLGGICLITGGALLGGLGAAAATGSAVGAGFFGILSGLLILATGVLDLAFAYGAWMLMPWAWMLGIIAEGVALLSALLSLLNGGNFFSFLISAAIAGAILYYLFTPEVKTGLRAGVIYQQKIFDNF